MEDNLDDIINNLYDELTELEDKLYKIDEDIEKLWESCILPYLESMNDGILCNLDDFGIFSSYIYKNNPNIRIILKKIRNINYELKELQN